MAPETRIQTTPLVYTAADPYEEVRPDPGPKRLVYEVEAAPDEDFVVKARGSDLLVEFEDGEILVIPGFLEYEPDALPIVRVADGPEFTGEAFLQRFNPRLLEVLQARKNSGVGEYHDDPGDLIDGVARLGDLPPFYWGGGVYDRLWQPYLIRTPDGPGGSFSFSAGTDLDGGGFVAGVYEDGQPHKNVLATGARGAARAGRMSMDFTLSGATTVTAVRLSGFDPGTRLYIGDPAQGGTLLEPGPDGVYALTFEQLTQIGVYLLPPPYSDRDMEISYQVDLSAEGGNITVSGTFEIVVDAVADLPENVVVTADEAALAGALVVDGQGAAERFDNGWADALLTKTQPGVAVDDSRVSIRVPVTLEAQFFDFDGSEQHTLYLEVPPGENWAFLVNGQPVQIVTDLPGYEGRAFFVIPESALAFGRDGAVRVTGELTATGPGGLLGQDTLLELTLLAVSEDRPGDRELSEDNNRAVAESTAQVALDSVSSGLLFRVGWASEGANGAKNGTLYDAGRSAGAYAAATDNGAAAYIQFGLVPPDGQGETALGEVITRIVLSYDPSLGTLLGADGQPLAVESVPGTSLVRVVLSGPDYISADGRSLVEGSVRFQPAPGYSGDDLAGVLNYEVSVSSSSGATADFSGSGTVVIDAVADRPDTGGLATGYGTAEDGVPYVATTPGGTVSVTGSARFYDLDGSELLYAVLSLPAGILSVAGLGPDRLLGRDQLLDFWRSVGGMPAAGSDAAVDAALQTALTAGPADGGQGLYLLIQYDPATGQVTVFARDPATGTSAPVVVDGLEVSFSNGVLSYSVAVRAGTGQEDAVLTIESQAVALERDPGDREYDYSNNIAGGEVTATEVQVIALHGYLVVSCVLFEDGQPNQNTVVDGTSPATGPKDTELQAGYDPATGYPITLTLTNAEPGEYIHGITVGALPDPSAGTIYYQGQPVNAGQIIDNPDLTGFSFKPAANYSGDVPFNFTYVVASHVTGPEEIPRDGTTDMRVDSVADLAEATSEGGGRADGSSIVETDEAVVRSDGWVTQESNEREVVNITFTVKITFGDLDGSEIAWMDIALSDGYGIPDGSPYQLVVMDGVRYARVSLPDLTTLQSTGGYLEVPVTLTMDHTVVSRFLEIHVHTRETDSLNSDGHSTTNNNADRVIDQDITAELFNGTFQLRAGWVYEGNKYGGNATEDLSSIGIDAASTTVNGAPLDFNVTGGVLIGFVITFDPRFGTLYLNGVAQTPTEGRYEFTDAQLQSGVITFMPAPGYSDLDVPFLYTVTVLDLIGQTFEIGGVSRFIVDAVADAGVISGDVGNQADNNTSLVITVTAAFADLDGSERHYILVEALPGWTCPDTTETITVYYDAQGNLLQPSGVDAGGQYIYDTSLVASFRTFFKLDVTGQSTAANGQNAQYHIRLVPPDTATDTTLIVGTLAEEVYNSLDGYERDLANNQAFQFSETGVNVIDSTLSMTATPAYEDHNPNQHLGGAPVDTDGFITVQLSNNGEVVNTAGGSIVLTFDWTGPGLPGSFTFNGVTYEPGSADFTLVSGNTWQLTLPADGVPAGSTSFSLRYNPPADDDTDLLNLNVSVPVISTGTGYTDTLTADLDRLIVDAVADKPTGLTGAPEYGTGLPGPLTAVESGAAVDVALNVRFGDYEDGSEQHYLVIDLGGVFSEPDLSLLPAGYTWTVLTAAEAQAAGLTAYANTGRYAILQVPNDYLQDTGGLFSGTVRLTTPQVDQDTAYTLNYVAVAVDTPSDGSDYDTTNNISETPGATTVNVHTITSVPVISAELAYENDMRQEHLGQSGTSGGARLSLGGMDSSEALIAVSVSFSAEAGQMHLDAAPFNGGAVTAGSHDLGNGVTLTCTLNNGVWTLSLSGDPVSNLADFVNNMRFVPAVNDSDTDVPLTITGTVMDTGSGQTQGFGPQQTTVIVDAVAQKPEDAEAGVTYEPGFTAAYDTVTVTARATFRDTQDNSERHFLLIEAKYYFDTTGFTTMLVGYDASGQPLTPVFDAAGVITGWVNPNPNANTDQAVTPTYTREFIVIDADTAIDGFDPDGPDTQTVNGFTVTRNDDGSFSVSIDQEIPVDTSGLTADLSESLVTGGMSVEGATPSGGDGSGGDEGYLYNNVGYDFDETVVNVAIVETVSVSVLFGSASEQDAPRANVGDPTLANGGGILVVRETPDAGDYSDEQITVTFTFDALYQEGTGQWILPGTIWYNGAQVPYTVDQATGTVTVVLTLPVGDTSSILDSTAVAGDQATRDSQIDGSLIRFRPNPDSYNDADVNISYTVSVEDTASGATAGDRGAGNGTLVIDAVADLPVIDQLAWAYQTQGYTASASPEVTLNFRVYFPDTGTNGVITEGQYILVERITGMDLTDDFKSALTQAGYSLEPFSLDGVLYYQIPVAFFSENPAGSGYHQVSLPLTLIGTGIADLENFTAPNIVALAVVENYQGQEITASNNAAEVIVDVPELNFAVVNTYIEGGSSYVYEGDTPGAHEGDYTPAGGSHFSLGIIWGASINGGMEEAVTGVTFTYDATRGTLYYQNDAGELVPIPNGTSVGAALTNHLVFIPVDTGLPNSDIDIPIGYSVTVQDPASGAQSTLTGTYLIIVDAVAQQPYGVTVDDVLYGGNGDGYLTYNEDVTLTISATFPDWAKSGDHATHYLLIQKPSDGWTCTYPGTVSYTGPDGTIYFAIPVQAGDYDPTGRVTLSITLETPTGGYLLYDDAAPLSVSALTIDRVDGNTDGELTFDNNLALADGTTVTFQYEEEEYNYLVVDNMYEGNNPDGNLLGDDGQPVNNPSGGNVHLNTVIQVPDGQGGYTQEDVEYVDLYWDSSMGDLYIDGVLQTPDSDGKVRIPASDFGKDIYFRVNSSYSDEDFGTVTANVHTTQGNDYSSSTYVPVDSVANVPTNVGAEPDYGVDGNGNPLTAVAPGENVDINVSATFHDLDGSEDLFLLVKVEPGWDNPLGYDIINGPDGDPYYRIPVDPSEVGPDGTVTKTVTLTPPQDGTGGIVGANGQTDYNLTVGAMTVENLDRDPVNGVDRGEETRENNNTSYNLTGQVTVTASTAESNPVLHTSNTYANNDLDGDGTSDPSASANIWITGLDTASDRLSQVRLTYNNQHGEILYNGQPVSSYPDVTQTVDGSGNVVLTITNPEILNALLAGSESSSAVQYVSNDYDDTDITVGGIMVVEDLFSSDSKIVGNNSQIIVDAVARRPENVTVAVTDPDFNGAVQSNSPVPVSVTASFPEMGDPTAANARHYLFIQQLDGWELDGPLPTGVEIVVGDDGNTYYRIDVDRYSDGSSPALVDNGDGSYTFSVTLLSPEFTQDVTNAAGITGGAMTIVEDSDLEITFENNVNQVTQEIPLSVGVVETTVVDWNFAVLVEDDPAGAAITLSDATRQALADHNEKVTETAFTFTGDFPAGTAGNVVGTVIYNGVAYEVVSNGDGTASVQVSFGPDGYDPADEFRLVWGQVQTDGSGNVVYDGGNPVVTDWNHTGSDMTVASGSTVVDNFSNDTVADVGGSSNLPFEPMADPPTDITVTDPADVIPGGGEVTFTVSARFADVDGSEDHYILVEQQTGWTGAYQTTVIDGVTYFMVPVDSTDPNPTATVTLIAPEDFDSDQTVSLAVGGMSVDGNSTAVTLDGATVTIDIGVVSADGVSLTMAGTDEDTSSQMLFALQGGDNESITAITVTDLQGGTIVDASGTVLFSGAPAVLDVATALAGGYYYLPPANASGTFAISYTAEVTDNGSGASKEFSSSGEVVVDPVTDVPTDPDGSGELDPGGAAAVTVTLSAVFEDTDGSETHFFLVQLPDGLDPPAGWTPVTDATLLDAAGLTGQTVYRVDADASGSAFFVLNLPDGYAGGDLTFRAGAVENETLAGGNPDYQFSVDAQVTLPAAPAAGDEPAGDAAGFPDAEAVLAAAARPSSPDPNHEQEPHRLEDAPAASAGNGESAVPGLLSAAQGVGPETTESPADAVRAAGKQEEGAFGVERWRADADARTAPNTPGTRGPEEGGVSARTQRLSGAEVGEPDTLLFPGIAASLVLLPECALVPVPDAPDLLQLVPEQAGAAAPVAGQTGGRTSAGTTEQAEHVGNWPHAAHGGPEGGEAHAGEGAVLFFPEPGRLCEAGEALEGAFPLSAHQDGPEPSLPDDPSFAVQAAARAPLSAQSPKTSPDPEQAGADQASAKAAVPDAPDSAAHAADSGAHVAALDSAGPDRETHADAAQEPGDDRSGVPGILEGRAEELTLPGAEAFFSGWDAPDVPAETADSQSWDALQLSLEQQFQELLAQQGLVP